MLEDIAILTGGSSSPRTWAASSRTRQVADLGRARRVVATKDDTTIIEGTAPTRRSRTASSRSGARSTTPTSDFDREKLQERLAKLAGGVAVIKVGAATEVELKEKKHRVEDALSATRAAVEEGIVPGGGVTYLRAQACLDEVESAYGDERTGLAILRRALEEPLRTHRRQRRPGGHGRRRTGSQAQGPRATATTRCGTSTAT